MKKIMIFLFVFTAMVCQARVKLLLSEKLNGYWKTGDGTVFLVINTNKAVEYRMEGNSVLLKSKFKVEYIDHCRFRLILTHSEGNIYPYKTGTIYEYECIHDPQPSGFSCKMVFNEKAGKVNPKTVNFSKAGDKEFNDFLKTYNENIKHFNQEELSWVIPGNKID